jgi:hypothetical protein
MMKPILSLMLLGSFVLFSAAQDEPIPSRLNVTPSYDNYPQGNPKETAASILRALNRERFDYLVAHLIEPSFVDERIKITKAKPQEVIDSVRNRFLDDPATLKNLKKILGEGNITEDADKATVTFGEVKGLEVHLVKLGERWFIRNERSGATPEKAPPATEKKDEEPKKEESKKD